MIMKLLPLILLLVGAGAGVGAGMFLRPPPPPPEAEMAEEGAEEKDGKKKEEKEDAKAEEKDEEEEPAEYEYVKLNNQFVIPIIRDDRIASMIVMSLSLEAAIGTQADLYKREAKIRDSFLQVLFDHANLGGFDGAFTDPSKLAPLRMALLEVAQRDHGEDIINDVLIVDIARQDY